MHYLGQRLQKFKSVLKCMCDSALPKIYEMFVLFSRFFFCLTLRPKRIIGLQKVCGTNDSRRKLRKHAP